MSCWLPPQMNSNSVNLGEALQCNHSCTRHCEFEPIWGNIFRCKTSFLLHICDSNCNQRIQLDNHRQICRLSRRVFEVQHDLANRKRGLERPLPTDCHMACEQLQYQGQQTHFDCGAKRRQVDGMDCMPLAELYVPPQVMHPAPPMGTVQLQGFAPPAGGPAAFGASGLGIAGWSWQQ